MALKPEWIGIELGERYRLERLVGQGGMSAVYQATDLRLRRPVAVKMIHSHLADDSEFQRRFEDEATAIARLRHPGIIQVYDFNHEDTTWYMVMEFVEGWTLENYRKALVDGGERLALEQTLQLMTAICRAVDYAHQQEIIHRDIKPANIMIRPSGNPVLMDFGIAKMVRASEKTATGMVLGTVSYMAPEQIKGLPIDHRVDIYSLTILLFELLVGQRPFESENNVATMQKHLADPPPDLRQFDPTIPEPLVHIIYKGLAKEPADRFATAAEMADALEAVGTGAPASPLDPTRLFGDAPVLESDDSQTTPHPVSMASEITTKNPVQAEEQPPAAASSRTLPRSMIAIISVVAILAVIYFLLPPAGRAAVMSPGSDEDADGLTAFEEFRLGTDPILADTDADGFPDKAELAVDCLDPLNADVDDDGLIDGDDPFACEPAEVDAAPQQVNITSITIIREDDMMDSGEMDPDYESDEAAAEGGNRTPLHYHVEFETVGFTPQTRDFHIHFFYNTVSPENSGIPGDGPWQVHQTSDPFEGYIVADKPAEATAICAVVANPDHTTIAATAQCADLPDS